MRLLSLPAILRAAGLTVHEVNGWRSRGAGNFGPVRGITCHHTAGSRTSTDAGEIRTLIHGSTSAPGPIAQLYLSRSGDWHVVASGVCWHNLNGWGGPNKGYGNYELVGIEAQHSGAGEPWTEAQYRSYVRGVAALCKGLDVPVGRVAGHKEHQPGAKNDPSFDMNRFRADVRDILEGDDDVTKDECKAAVREILTKEPIQLVGGPAKRLAAAKWRTKLTLPEMLGYLLERAVVAEVTDLKTLLAAIAADDANPVKLDPATIDTLADELVSRLPQPEPPAGNLEQPAA